MLDSANDMTQWLIDRIRSAKVSPVKDINPDTELEALGLDSLAGVMLVDELETGLGISIEPSELWEHDTVAALGGSLFKRKMRLAAQQEERVQNEDLI